MKKPKLKEKFENVINDLFKEDIFTKNDAIVFVGNQELTQVSSTTNLTQKADKYFNLFKQFFCFAPGVLFLHFAVPGIFTIKFGSWTSFFLASGIVMVWVGIGDLKNKKHILLPTSAILITFLFSIPFYVLSPQIIADYYTYLYIGILPLLFITPILTKNLLDKIEINEKNYLTTLKNFC